MAEQGLNVQNFFAQSTCKVSTLSADRLPELQEDIDRLDRAGRLSDHPTYRGYLGEMKFALPESFLTARSLVVMAVSSQPALVNFHLDGQAYPVIIPPQYYNDGRTREGLYGMVKQAVGWREGYRIESISASVHLKLLAVRSGLGLYGRNNVCYVEGMGSMLALYGFLTDMELPDRWTEIRMMDACRQCRVCIKKCPTGALTEENFVIDAGRCVTLYNEVAGDFPQWLGRDVHSALVGCTQCQWSCPANREAVALVNQLEDVTAQETEQILQGSVDEATLTALAQKLRRFYPTSAPEHVPVLTRNLRAVLDKG